MARFTNAEVEFLKANEACRIATCHDNIPHVVPVSYIFEEGIFYFATDLETRKFQNIKKNRRVALAVDVYSSTGNSAIIVQGRAELIEHGGEFTRLYKMFEKKFAWVRADPWKEGEAPFVRIFPIHKASWGMK